MSKKLVTTIISALLIVILAIGGVLFYYYNKNKIFDWEYQLSYVAQQTVTTSTNNSIRSYYQFNFDLNKIRKCEDKFLGLSNEQYEYKEKVLYEVEIPDNMLDNIKTFLEKTWQTGADTDEHPNTYRIEKFEEGARQVRGEATLIQLRDYLKTFEELGATASQK